MLLILSIAVFLLPGKSGTELSLARAPYPKSRPSPFGRHLAIPEPLETNEVASVSAEFLER